MSPLPTVEPSGAGKSRAAALATQHFPVGSNSDRKPLNPLPPPDMGQY